MVEAKPFALIPVYRFSASKKQYAVSPPWTDPAPSVLLDPLRSNNSARFDVLR